jgi:hypothetical protein
MNNTSFSVMYSKEALLFCLANCVCANETCSSIAIQMLMG